MLQYFKIFNIYLYTVNVT